MTNKGAISSTNYPRNYKANQDCEWLLEVPPDHTMTINITDIDLYESENCTHTELQIFDGEDAEQGNSLFRWCNSSAPARSQLYTVSNRALVKFRSGVEFLAKGFLINFETNCGYTIKTNGSGMIRLHDSGVAKLCKWVITSEDPMARVKLTINHFSGNSTSIDDVITFDNSMATSVGLTMNTMYSVGNVLGVMLQVRGPTVFEATYSVYENGE